MICKNCSAEYDDSFSSCPECGKPVEDGFMKNDVYVQDIQEDEIKEYEASPKSHTMPVYYAADDRKEKTEEDKQSSEEIKPEGEIKVKPVASKKRKPEKEQVSKAEKKALMLIVIALCAVGLFTAVLTSLNITTDAFEGETTAAQKTVALSKLSAEEEALLEKEIAVCYSALKTDFNSDTCDSETFLSRVNPGDAGNFYSLILGESAPLQTTPDPALRFGKENGTYSYYKTEASKVEKLLSRFGLSSYGDANCKDYYFYDGFYYFNAVATANTPVVSADVTKSKKVLDGSYYAECFFYVNNAGSTVKSDTYYLLVKKTENSVSDGYSFRIYKANDEPLFNEAGNPTNAGGASGYTIKNKVFEGKTEDGKLFCRYVIDYPVFSGNSAGEKAINQFFEGTLSSYELKASDAQKSYESFISAGGNEQELPFTEAVVARVTFSDDEKISFVEKIASYSPKIPEKEVATTTSTDDEGEDYGYYEEPAEETQQSAELFTRTVEGYTFDRETGEFVVKDEILGKSYMTISEVLYRIYNSYEYEGILPEKLSQGTTDANGNVIQNGIGETTTEATTQDSYDYYDDDDYYDYYDDYYYDDEYDYYDDESRDDDGIPDDEDGFGTVIYESACCYTEGGFTFYYVEEDGYVTEVTIPWDAVERLAA